LAPAPVVTPAPAVAIEPIGPVAEDATSADDAPPIQSAGPEPVGPRASAGPGLLRRVAPPEEEVAAGREPVEAPASPVPVRRTSPEAEPASEPGDDASPGPSAGIA
jgi:arginase